MLEKIYEKLTGRCWHVYSKIPKEVFNYKCMKCGKII